MTLVERDPERAERIANYNRSRNEFYALAREHAALGTRVREAKAQMEFDLERLKALAPIAPHGPSEGGP